MRGACERRCWSTLAGVALYFVLESAAGTTLIGAFGVVWPLVIMAIGLMMLGVPIVDSLIFGTFVAFLPQGELALLPVPQSMTNALDYLLLAIPFFMLAAGLMNVGGITESWSRSPPRWSAISAAGSGTSTCSPTR